MGKRRLHIIKRHLAERARALQENIDRSILSIKKGGDSLPDLYDLAASESAVSTELAIRERDRYLLLSRREALRRIEQGSYGTCKRCGGAIAFERLMASPATTVCIECKTEEESPGKGAWHRTPRTEETPFETFRTGKGGRMR
jgi:DnaK suppressor protein